ncbi:MAG: glycosyltransferase family 39 protein [Bacteroidota bacterium]|nr:glycosyltransferase family 39 protein [Bacteroidota bacterium]
MILITTVVRLLIANVLELGNDEVYYWTYPLHLQLSYFDHPPLIAILIRLTTFNLFFQQDFFLRLGPIIGAAAGTWLSYSIGKSIKNERTGWFAALLYNSCIYSSIIAGLFILPDSPQIVLWLLAIKTALYIFSAEDEHGLFKKWVLWGVYTGVCIMCKVHGIFLWVGLGLYIIIYKRSLLTHRHLYLSLIITLIIISPIFIWNWSNDFITWKYHSARVHALSFDKDSFISGIIGQIFYNNPINVFLIVVSFLFYRKQKFINPIVYRVLILFGLPMIVVVAVISMFNNILPHWSGPAFITLQFMAASYLDDRYKITLAIPKVIKYALGLVAIGLVMAIVIIKFYPGTIGNKNEKQLGSGDFTLDLYGWKKAGYDFGKWITYAKENNIVPANTIIVCNKWFPASHIDYYFARKNNMQVIGVGDMDDLHNYIWLNHYRNSLKKGDSAVCIVPSNYAVDLSTTYLTHFSAAKLIHIITSERGNLPVRYFNMYLLTGYMANDEAHNILVK